MLNKSRRTFLKGLAYGSAVSVSGLSGLAIAQSNPPAMGVDTSLATSDIHYLPTQQTESETLSLYNHTDKEVIINGIDRINIDRNNQLLAVKVNKVGEQSQINSTTLAPFESREIVVAAASSNYRGIKASHEAVPVSIFGSQAA